MDLLQRRLHDPEVLVRLNAFLLSYFGWIAFGVLYGYIGRWSIDVTSLFLGLPLTSRSFVVGLVNFTKSIPVLYALFTGVYYLGFTGSIALTVIYLLLYLRDLQASDELLIRYLSAYTIAGLIYLTFHIYAPHVVYGLPGYTSENTLLTRQEFVLPSLHNTIITINIITLWRYRKRLWGKTLIAINALIPFATLFLGHHWVYDIVTGILLGAIVSKRTRGITTRVPQRIYDWETASLRRVTVLNFILAIIVLLLAVSPEKWSQVLSDLFLKP